MLHGAAELATVTELVLSFYRPCLADASLHVRSLGNHGGFSGARLWEVRSGGRIFCLRRWPSGDRAGSDYRRQTHRQLAAAFDDGCDFVPVPLPARDGETLVRFDGAWWQLEPWMPGSAEWAVPVSPQRLFQAMQGLARLHRAFAKGTAGNAVPPALVHRQQELERWFRPSGRRSEFDELAQAALKNADWGELAGPIVAGAARFAPPVRARVAELSNRKYRLQTVGGDVWRDHLLFEGERLTGIVDFGAMKMDQVSLDLARLVPSLVGRDRPARADALRGYREFAPFSGEEAALAAAYESSGAILAGLNWLHWLCRDGREMGPREAVHRRIQEIAGLIAEPAQPDDWR